MNQGVVAAAEIGQESVSYLIVREPRLCVV